ncbi:MAG TPA: cbb3-type cytochrome oxidase assembly protein CcoS [Rhodocyclaceae bacterium]|nr:cbb3-type cytochrome oxidase assembly protein CcoS [Rhodocyclaceae bacterium]
MLGLYLLIPLSVVLVFTIGIIFWWSVRSGQYDDLEGPAYRMLLDDRDLERPVDKTEAKPEMRTNSDREDDRSKQRASERDG